MKVTEEPDAVIYCRVSSDKQVKEGHGLSSQETRCREFAKHKGYNVVEVFSEEGVSGGLIDRPQMQKMLAFLRRHKKRTEHVVLIDDISRLARDLEAHIKLRTSIGTAGGKLESPSVEFGEDSDSILVENLLASVSQHQRQKNAEQVSHRMRARVINGYWCFSPPVGYRYRKVPNHGKLLVPMEPEASIIKDVFEGLASGRFETIAEIARYLQNTPAFPRGRDNKVHYSRTEWMLRSSIYAGFIDVPSWKLELHPGKHEPLISFETWKKAQTRLDGNNYAAARKDVREDFPLRGVVCCGECNEPMTAGWSKGRSKKYPYYWCTTKACEDYSKTIQRDRIESDFEALLADLTPSDDLCIAAFDIFRDLWMERIDSAKSDQTLMKKELAQTEFKITQFLDRIVETQGVSIIAAYEKRIHDLEEHKLILNEKIANCGKPLTNFDETFKSAFKFLSNPCNLWLSPRLEDQRAVPKLVFADRLGYTREKGFLNSKTTLPFNVLGAFSAGEIKMVGDTGIEPVTPTMSILGNTVPSSSRDCLNVH